MSDEEKKNTKDVDCFKMLRKTFRKYIYNMEYDGVDSYTDNEKKILAELRKELDNL